MCSISFQCTVYINLHGWLTSMANVGMINPSLHNRKWWKPLNQPIKNGGRLDFQGIIVMKGSRKKPALESTVKQCFFEYV